MRRRRHCRMVFPQIELERSRRLMFLDWQFTAKDDEYLEPALINIARRLFLVDAMYRDGGSCGVRTSMSDNDAALAPRWTQGFPKKMGSIFRRAPMRPQAPPAAPVCVGSRLALASRRMANVLQKLRHLAQAGRKRNVSPQPATALLRYSRDCGRIPGQACGKRAGDVDHRQSHRCRRMDREGRAQLSGSEWRRIEPPLSAEKDRVRVSYSLSYSVSPI